MLNARRGKKARRESAPASLALPITHFFKPINQHPPPCANDEPHTNEGSYAQEGRTLFINKVPVRLPVNVNPYKTQQLVMVRIIQALQAKQSVMLESPTGSGKTLGLLASTCEWLLKYKEECAETKAKCPIHGAGATVPPAAKPTSPPAPEPATTTSYPVVRTTLDESKYAAELDEDVPLRKPLPPRSVKQPGTASTPKCICKEFVRVYYGTRTHRQIGQVVREFSRLPASKQLKHSILASRDQLCINQRVRQTSDVTAACKALLAPGGTDCACRVAMHSKRLNCPESVRTHLEQQGAPQVWDIEDLTRALDAVSSRICPYFVATRICTQDADIIFAPFSYLLDSAVRIGTSVALENAVVILDEAHNVEDVCRGASSFDFHEEDVIEAIRVVDVKLQTVPKVLSQSPSEGRAAIQGHVEALKWYHTFLKRLEELLRAETLRITGHHDDALTAHSAQNMTFPPLITEPLQMRQVLQNARLLPDDDQQFEQMIFNVATVANRNTGSGSRDAQSPIAPLVASLVPGEEAIDVGERWLRFVRYFRDSDNYTKYKMCTQLERTDGETESGDGHHRKRGSRKRKSVESANVDLLDAAPGTATSDSQSDAKRGGAVRPHYLKLSLWCMLPSIAFMDAFNEARSVILASGTLQPWTTLSSELGREFRHKVEGDQVVSPDRVLASILHVGPTGHTLNAGYAATNAQEKMRTFCAELTKILRATCDDVPGGVLCFLPSYRMMDELQRFIESDQLLLGTHKAVLFEPHRSADLAATVRRFEQAVKAPWSREITGALLLAVHRGKVSEGIDFADELARCVVSVGIPYMSAADPQVEHKRRFNDALSHAQTGILSGGDWYATQAFRALNQSLGRCIRHAGDWGALVLVDERLAGQRERGLLSKWIRDRVQEYREFDAFRAQLQQFVAKWTTPATDA